MEHANAPLLIHANQSSLRNPIPVVSWIDSRSSNPYSAIVRSLSGIGSSFLIIRELEPMNTRTRNFILGLLALPFFSFAQDDLERLKTSYENAVARAVEPLKATYERELRSLMQRHAESGRLDDVARVVAELKAIGITNAVPADADTGRMSRSTQTGFEGTTWKTPTGTEFSFEPEGKGTRSFGGADPTSITWRKRAGGFVEVTGAGSQGGQETTWFFRFVSESEAYYGNNKEGATTQVQRIQN